jgi:hypothetical protein
MYASAVTVGFIRYVFGEIPHFRNKTGNILTVTRQKYAILGAHFRYLQF